MRVLGDSVKARYLESLALAAPPPPAALADPEKAWVEEVEDEAARRGAEASLKGMGVCVDETGE